MSYRFNPFTGNLDTVIDNEMILDVLDAPPEAEEGRMYIDSSSNEMMVCYGGIWVTLHTFGAPVYYYLLLESNDNFLLEDGNKLILG